MAISLKSTEQIGLIRESGKIVAETFELFESQICPRVTTALLDGLAAECIRSRGAVPSFLGCRGFPVNICASVHNGAFHGVSGLRRIVSGDIVSIDIGVFKNRHHADAAMYDRLSAHYGNTVIVTAGEPALITLLGAA